MFLNSTLLTFLFVLSYYIADIKADLKCIFIFKVFINSVTFILLAKHGKLTEINATLMANKIINE